MCDCCHNVVLAEVGWGGMAGLRKAVSALSELSSSFVSCSQGYIARERTRGFS